MKELMTATGTIFSYPAVRTENDRVFFANAIIKTAKDKKVKQRRKANKSAARARKLNRGK